MEPLENSTNDVPDQLIKENGGILPMFEAFYIESIIYAADRAVAAFERFDEALLRGENTPLVVANIQEALTHVGELSRLFWPARDNGTSDARGEKLRQAFNLEESSPLKNRDLRNTLEHFDERLDIYLKQFPIGQVISSSVVGLISSLASPIRAFRLVDPQRSTFVILDEQYEFGPLRDSTKNVLSQAKEMIKNGARLE